MLKIKTKYPLREYQLAKKTPQFCNLQGYEFVVPLSYNGNVNKFIDDLFDKTGVLNEYHQKNETSLTYVEIDGHRVFVPHRWSKHKLDHQMINRMMDRAILDYNSAMRITRFYKKTNKEKAKGFLSTLDKETIDGQIESIVNFFGGKVKKGLIYLNDKTAIVNTKLGEKAVRPTVNYLVKKTRENTAKLFYVAAYAFSKKDKAISAKLINIADIYKKKMDKDVIEEGKTEKFAEKIDEIMDNVCENVVDLIEDKVSPLLNNVRKRYHNIFSGLKNTTTENKTKAAIGGTVIFTGMAGIAAHSSKTASASNGNNNNQTEVFDVHNNQENITTPIKYGITDRASFDEAFDASLPLIHRALLATEWFSDNGYSDNNNTASNTLAGGLWWFPEDYAEKRDPTSQDWEHTKDFLRKHPDVTVCYKEGMKLTEGWYMHRNTLKDKEHPKTVVDNMYERLKGCELAPNELAAIASVYYNDEECGRRLCSFVRKNYKDPVACANYISLLRPKDKSFEAGIKKRHFHEALFYLNKGDYCSRVLDFNVCSGINSKGKFFITTAVTQLELESFEQFRRELRNGNINENTVCNLTDKMCAYNPRPQSSDMHATSIKKFLRENLNGRELREMTQLNGYDINKSAHNNTINYNQVLNNLKRRRA